MPKKGSGWKYESYRHSIAKKGVKTIPMGTQTAVKGRTVIIDAGGNTLYLPSRGIRDWFKTNITGKLSKWWNKDGTGSPEEKEAVKAVVGDAADIEKVPYGIGGLPESGEDAEAEEIMVGEAAQKEKQREEHPDETEEEAEEEGEGEGISESPAKHDAEEATVGIIKRTYTNIRESSPEFEDVTPQETEAMDRTVDVDKLAHIINNRARLIDLRSDVKQAAKLILSHADTVSEEYEQAEQELAAKAQAEYEARQSKIRRTMDAVGYSAFKTNRTPADHKIEMMKVDLDQFWEKKKVQVRDVRREHAIDVSILKEKGRNFLGIAAELDMKLQEMSTVSVAEGKRKKHYRRRK